MRKYTNLFLINWQNGLVYRTSVLLWRFRQLMSTLMALTIWQVIYQGTPETLGYTQSSMVTYVFLASMLQSVVLSSALMGLANIIYSGEFSNQLLKPVNMYGYLATQEAADKLKNLFFLIIESTILYFLFLPEIVLPSLINGLFFVMLTCGAIVLNFLITLLFGAIGFWSPDTWGPRFIFFMIVDFTAGKLFPLDIFPDSIQKIIFLTPLPFFTFVPTQIFLERFDFATAMQHALTLTLWIIVLWCLVWYLWKKGIKNFSAAGH
ncbi:MAG: ABC-2 family transporter protein [Microgenomates group bacterium]